MILIKFKVLKSVHSNNVFLIAHNHNYYYKVPGLLKKKCFQLKMKFH